MLDIIPIDLMVAMVGMVVPLMILMEVAQIVPLPLNLEDDVDMTDILNSMSNKQNPKVLALGKARGTVIKCLK